MIRFREYLEEAKKTMFPQEPSDRKIPEGELKLKFKTHQRDIHGMGTYSAFHGNRRVGFVETWNDYKTEKFSAASSETHIDYRKRGVMNALYNHVEKETGKKLHPSSTLSDDGKAFWEKRRASALKDGVDRDVGGQLVPMKEDSQVNNFLGGLKRLPDRAEKDRLDGHIPKEGEVHSPFYHKDAEKVWGDDDAHYIPQPKTHSGMTDTEFGKAHGKIWDKQPIENLDTSLLTSPQPRIDVHHTKTVSANANGKPIHVVRTKSGEHIIQDGNHRAAFAHAATGKVMAHVFPSSR